MQSRKLRKTSRRTATRSTRGSVPIELVSAARCMTAANTLQRRARSAALKPLAQSRNETNSSWVNGADKSGFIFQICASGAAVQARFVCHNQADLLPGFLSGRLISSNEGTWVLFHHDSST